MIMMNFTDEELLRMPLEKAKTELSNRIYDTARIIELLGGKGKVRGNGHHIRQNIAAYAENLLEEKWRDKRR